MPGLQQSEQIYLDNNSTTPIADVAIETIEACWNSRLANPASQHQTGQVSSRILNRVRELVLNLLDASATKFPADKLIWTGCGTEANNLILFGRCLDERGRIRPGNLVISGIEHPSVTLAAQQLQRLGVELRIAQADSNGVVSLDDLNQLVDEATLAVSVMLANNETGVIQPLQSVSKLCRDRNVFCHTDAVQAIGKTEVSFEALGVDALTFAPHKFHGPVGIAGLLLKSDASLQPRLMGGFQQEGLRPGTENIALAAGAAAAMHWYFTDRNRHESKLRSMRNEFESLVTEAIPTALVIGKDVSRLPNTSCIAFPGVDRQEMVLAADMAGVACSTGSACASGSSDPSPVLQNMGLSPAVIDSALRFSFGLFNSLDDATESARRISLAHSKLQSRSHD